MWRTHVLPESESDLRRLGRSMGLRSDPVVELTDAWRRHAVEVRRLHEKLFYRPLLAAVARLPEDESRLTPEAARARLAALGYADPAGALRHLEALTAGLSRRAAIQRTLLPVMLGWFADAADPDAGLLSFRQVSDGPGLDALVPAPPARRGHGRRADGPRPRVQPVRQRAAAARSRGHVDARRRQRAGATRRARRWTPRSRAAVHRASTAEGAATAARAIRRRELFRIAAADALGLLDVDAVGEGLTAVANATLAGALAAATRAVETGRPPVTRMALVAMGRLGGHEMSYSSDADVVFVHEPVPGAEEKAATDAAHAIANEMRRLMSMASTEPALVVDADLRPEGRQGPLVRSLASYQAYYARWSSLWEAQALLRAEFVAGDREVGERFTALIDPIRRPEAGLTDDQVREIRRIKARIESERLPRGADPATHTKLGRGGLADVEWVAQLLQLQHGAKIPSLQTTRTLDALEAARAAGILATPDAAVLAESWRMATRVRNAIMLVRGRPGDSPPTGGRELSSMARGLGYAPGETGRLLEDYRRVTRRARAVVERVFYA